MSTIVQPLREHHSPEVIGEDVIMSLSGVMSRVVAPGARGISYATGCNDGCVVCLPFRSHGLGLMRLVRGPGVALLIDSMEQRLKGHQVDSQGTGAGRHRHTPSAALAPHTPCPEFLHLGAI